MKSLDTIKELKKARHVAAEGVKERVAEDKVGHVGRGQVMGGPVGHVKESGLQCIRSH